MFVRHLKFVDIISSADRIGITGGGTDFGFDDDGEPPATSIHNPTVD